MSVKITLAVVLFSIMITGSFGANAQLIHYLNTYMPNSTIDAYAFFNISIGNNHYIIMKHMYQYSFIVINSTQNFSIIENASQIYEILKPFVLNTYTPNSTVLNLLNASMQKFEAQAAPPLNDCRQETGLDQYTCNASNACFSCQTVPICGKWMPYYGGPTGVLGLGIMNFSAQYSNLTSNYTMFSNALHTMQSNPGKSIQVLKAAINNIAHTSYVLPQNPLFPPPHNFTASQMASCSSYSIPTQEPWYCVDIGMCEYTTFNSSLLTSMQNTVHELSMLPLSNSSIEQLSVNSSKLAISFIKPVETAKYEAVFSSFMNATMPIYNSTLGAATALLSRVSNTTLSMSVSRLEGTYAEIKKLGINQSISLSNTELMEAIANTSALSAKLDALYAPLNSSSFNNSIALIKYQLDFKNIPPELAQLSARQQSIHLALVQGISSSSINSYISNETSIKDSLARFAGTPFTLAAFVKGFDGSMVSSMLYGSNAPIQSKIAGAPAYAALISFIIGLIILLLIYSLTYARLKKRKKIRINRRVKRTWSVLFILLFVLVLIYAYATYAYAQSANTFLPVSIFTSLLHSSSSAVIMVNDSSSLSVQQLLCAASLQKELKYLGKSVAVFAVENYSCITSNATLSGLQCSNKFLADGIPVIYMGSGAQSSIIYKGMYGNILYAQGNITYGSTCVLSSILK